MMALFRMVGITPKQRSRMSPGERNAVARKIRREAAAYGIPKLRATSSPYAVSRRRAKNRVARRTRRAQRRAAA